MRKRIALLCFFIAALCLCAVPTAAYAGGTVSADDATWNGGTWNVTNSVELNNRVAVDGEVTLVLGAGTTLTAPKGITVITATRSSSRARERSLQAQTITA